MPSRSLVLICAGAAAGISVAHAQAPAVAIETAGVPQVRIEETVSRCPDRGVSAGTRQAILDAAAVEWAAFDFPRFALTDQKAHRVIPDGISPRIADTT